MLEALISSRIRRALVEHFLTHPRERFYLRGLAKELNLSMSPARRELIRLEQMGVLTAYPEANIRFYVLNTASSLVSQLTRSAGPPDSSVATATLTADPVGPTTASPEWPVAASVLTHAKVERMRRALKPPSPWLVSAGAAVMTLSMLAVAVASYREITASRSMAREAARVPRTQVTVIEQPIRPSGASASGQMRSSRWRIVPGGLGAFSPAKPDSY